MMLFWLAVALPSLFWDQGPETAGRLQQAGITRIAVPQAMEAAWKGQAGFDVSAASLDSAVKVNKPGVQYRVNEASATRSPWIDANGWEFLRKPNARFAYDAPGMAAPLAAAEAFMYSADALVKTDAEGLQPLGEMLKFLRALKPAQGPLLSDIAFIDDGSDEAGEVMNLMGRKNLLYHVAAKPDPKAKLTVKFGSAKYPKAEAADPTEMAQKVRYELTDDRRSLRVFGGEVVLGRLVSNGRGMRVELLNYAAASRALNGIRVRVLGQYRKHQAHAFGSADLALVDYAVTADATEFTLPQLKSFAVIDLEP